MPPELKDVLLLAIFNPAMLVVGFWLGRRANQLQKVVIAGFIAGLAGAVFALLVMRFGTTTGTPKLIPGIFVAGAIAGMLVARVGYWVRVNKGKG